MDKNRSTAWGEMLESVAIAIVLAALIRIFLFQPFYIPTGSMVPTLMINDRVIVSKFIYWFSEPKRGDIIVFKYPVDPRRDFIKRVIAVGGDTVEARDSRLYINGKPVDEPYLPPGLEFEDFGPVKIDEGHFFVMGDNRNNSEDSRFWGLVPSDNIVGKAMLIYWPLSRMEWIWG